MCLVGLMEFVFLCLFMRVSNCSQLSRGENDDVEMRPYESMRRIWDESFGVREMDVIEGELSQLGRSFSVCCWWIGRGRLSVKDVLGGGGRRRWDDGSIRMRCYMERLLRVTHRQCEGVDVDRIPPICWMIYLILYYMILRYGR